MAILLLLADLPRAFVPIAIFPFIVTEAPYSADDPIAILSF